MANRHQEDKSRAEKVRSRRHQRHTDVPKVPIGGSATRKPKDRHVSVTRRPTTSVPVVTRRKHTTYVPLKKKGAELQIPTLPRIQLGWRLISGAIFLLSLAVIISFTSLSTFQVSTINLRGAQRLTNEALLSRVDLLGTSIIQLDPQEIKANIEDRFTGLSSVRISVGLPASVTIQVEERVPLILWQQDSTALWIDSEGIMFPVNGEAEVAQTVLATGNPPSAPEVFIPDVDEETGVISHLLEQPYPHTTVAFVEAVLSVSEYIPEGTPLQYSPDYGLGWQDPNGWQVYFGRDIENITMKLAEYQTLVGALQNQNITPAMISLEFLHAPYFRLEQ